MNELSGSKRLLLFMKGINRPVYGNELIKEFGFEQSVYVFLHRLHKQGKVECEWVTVEQDGRPFARKMYTVKKEN